MSEFEKITMSEFERLETLLERMEAVPSDAIVLLAGDRFHRIPKVAELVRDHFGSVVVVTSSADNWEYGSAPSGKLVPELEMAGVPKDIIISEETTAHTRGEADATLRIAKEKGWTSLILVTTGYHRVRAFLTWLKAMHDADLSLKLSLACVEEFPEFKKGQEEETKKGEQDRIRLYQKKGDVASWEEGIKYLSQ